MADRMTFRVSDAVEVLARTPAVLQAMLAGLSDSWVFDNYGPDTFSPFDVVGHLIHGERTDWMVRVQVILQHGETRAFEPFERYAMYEESKGKSMQDLLGEFGRLRHANLEALAALRLSPQQLALSGRHPALGRVTLGQLLAAWVVHDLNHVHQIAKCMAYQYRDEVGPWREYLTILPRKEAAHEAEGAGMTIDKTVLSSALQQVHVHWRPKVIARLNGQEVKLVKFQGAFVWHYHEHEDELFLVIRGRFRMEFRDRTIELGAGEMLVVPRGVEHRPVADQEVEVLLFEPAGVRNTGNVVDPQLTAPPSGA